MLNFSSKRSYVFLIELLNPSRTRAVSKYEVPTFFGPKKSFAKWTHGFPPKKNGHPSRCSVPASPLKHLETLQRFPFLHWRRNCSNWKYPASLQDKVPLEVKDWDIPSPCLHTISGFQDGEAGVLTSVAPRFFFGNPTCWRRNFLCQLKMWKFQGCQFWKRKKKQWRSSDGEFNAFSRKIFRFVLGT